MKKTIFILIFIWLLLVSASFFWNYLKARESQEELAFHNAKSFFNQVVITRKWNAQHGGVYVPVTESTQPNPYLEAPKKNIEANDSETKLTMINPAFMTRQISEIAAEQEGIRFHITSLMPIRPGNKPGPMETEALESFEKGTKEVGKVAYKDGDKVYFYMAPLIAEKECLKCHAKQGYKEGDIRGGISVTFPFVSKVPLTALATGHIGIGIAGLIGIIIFGIKLDGYYEVLRRQSIIDALTGIPNRRHFSDTIVKEYRRAQREKFPLSLIMCDIDKFKEYNDTYGHEAGDECLRKVAQVIEKSLLRPGDFCARYGGEEFVIILPYSDYEGAMYVAEKIRENVEEKGIPHEKSSPLNVVTLSLGVATLDKSKPVSDRDLVNYADKALYKAKEKGRNRVETFDSLV